LVEIAAEDCTLEKAGGRHKVKVKVKVKGAHLKGPLQSQLQLRRQLQEHRQDCLCRDGLDWMVLEPSIAGYGTLAGSSLYSAGVRLDNLGRCVERAGDAGDGVDCARRCFITAQLLSRLQTKLYYRERSDDLHGTSSFPGTPIGPSPKITAGFAIVPGLLLGMNAAPGIRGVNTR